MAVPLNTCTTIEQCGIVQFLWATGMAAKDIHKEMLPIYGEHCLSRQAVHNCVQKFSEGWTSIEDEHWVGQLVKEQCVHGSNSNHKNFILQVSRDLWNGGQVRIFAWRLCWKINVVCMLLSPFVSLQSQFVTYLLTFSHITSHFINLNTLWKWVVMFALGPLYARKRVLVYSG